MSARHRRRSPSIARQSAELALAVPEVVAHRVTRMWLGGMQPSARDRRELHRMSSEKVAAFYESWGAMWMALFQGSLRSAFTPMARGWWIMPRGLQRASAQGRRVGLAIAGAGLSPVHRRATGNAKRLRRQAR